MIGFSEALLIALATAIASFAGSIAAGRVTLRYMQRDIVRAQDTADNAHERIDGILGDRAKPRIYGITELPKDFDAG